MKEAKSLLLAVGQAIWEEESVADAVAKTVPYDESED